MSNSDRNRYFNAVKAVNSGPKPTEWDIFARQHAVYYDGIHGRPMFDAWHRKYLAELEKLLRNKSPFVRIPYWDWSEYYNNRDKDPIWKWFGKEGNNTKDKCVTDGVFKDFIVFYTDNLDDNGREKCFTRKNQIDTTFGCVIEYINHDIIDEKDVQNSQKRIEYNCHNGVHTAIGEDFVSGVSTNDPLFFSHHAFIDMVWFTKQMRYPSRSQSYPQPISDKIPWWEIPIKDVLDTRDLCYTYPADRYSWLPPINSNSVNFIVSSNQVEPFVPLLQSKYVQGRVPSAVIDNHARIYVFKNITSPISKPPSALKGSKCQLNSLRDIVSIDYIRKMKLDERLTRELEREQAIFMHNLNMKCL